MWHTGVTEVMKRELKKCKDARIEPRDTQEKPEKRIDENLNLR